MTKKQCGEVLTQDGMYRLWMDRVYGPELREAKSAHRVKAIAKVARAEYCRLLGQPKLRLPWVRSEKEVAV